MKWFKKVLTGIMSLVLVAGLGMNARADGLLELPVDVYLSNAEVYGAGEGEKSLSFVIKNRSDQDISGLAVTPIYSDNPAEWPFLEVNSSSHRIELQTIGAGQEEVVTIDGLTVRNDVSTRRCKIAFAVVGSGGAKTVHLYPDTREAAPVENETQGDGEGEVQVPEAPADAAEPVVNSDPIPSGSGKSSNSGSVPRVIVTGFSTEPAEVSAGSNFKLIVHLKNTSKKTAVSNMVFDFAAPSEGTGETATVPAFLPTSGSSTIYKEKIPANGTADIAIDLNARADLVQKPYSLELAMKYEDSNAVQYDGKSGLSVPVKQNARFEFSDIEVSPESVTVGSEANVMCNLYNLGRIKLYNVKVTFSGQGISSKDVFVGNVEPGASAAIDGLVTGTEVSAAAENKVKMTVSYEDEGGNISQIDKEVNIPVTEGEEEKGALPDEAMMAEPVKAGFPILPVGGALLGIVILAAVIIVIRKKKAAKGDGLSDELDRFIQDE